MTHKRTRPRARRAADGGQDVDVLALGLLTPERQWLALRAAEVGGMTAVFRCLVHLVILSDAMLAALEACKARASCAPPAAHERCALARLGARHLNALAWLRPDRPGAYGDVSNATDDPTVPLSRATVRRLIVDGRPEFLRAVRPFPARRVWTPDRKAVRARVAMPAGLSAQERAWLRRLARALGGLANALRFLVRCGLDSYIILWGWKREQNGASGAVTREPTVRGTRRSRRGGRP